MKPVVPDPWAALRARTPARLALGRAGAGLPTRPLLELGLAHARARDAVHHPLEVDRLCADLAAAGFVPQVVRSAAQDRGTYLARPDLGRRLRAGEKLEGEAEIVVAIEDGLSALAVQAHAVPLLRCLPERWKEARVVVALQGRVALGDEIGERMKARLVAVLIGERPGLSSPDSLGIYLTWAPKVGRTDAERNCISNVRPQGLGYAEAARKLDWLAAAALARGQSGVALKDYS
ncbi:MAG TPA: ethanolamine ammonia-lyase subunit EutC [Burkholderiales bacterium]|nr:ethanolamine ammonia-lyase subunit EutC [Burkholderiales bacterium]